MKIEEVELGMKIVDSRFPLQVGEVIRIWESGGTHRATTVDSFEVRFSNAGVWEHDRDDEGFFKEYKGE